MYEAVTKNSVAFPKNASVYHPARFRCMVDAVPAPLVQRGVEKSARRGRFAVVRTKERFLSVSLLIQPDDWCDILRERLRLSRSMARPR